MLLLLSLLLERTLQYDSYSLPLTPVLKSASKDAQEMRWLSWPLRLPTCPTLLGLLLLLYRRRVDIQDGIYGQVSRDQ
eukprot:112719-Amphidinium_carterae.1